MKDGDTYDEGGGGANVRVLKRGTSTAIGCGRPLSSRTTYENSSLSILGIPLVRWVACTHAAASSETTGAVGSKKARSSL